MNELTTARLHAGLSVSEACALLGRSVRTWRHWKRHGAPDWALQVLALYGGDLSPVGWHGWKIRNGTLYAPDLRYGWTPEQLYAEWWHRQLLSHYQRRQREAASVNERQGSTAFGRSEDAANLIPLHSVSNHP